MKALILTFTFVFRCGLASESSPDIKIIANSSINTTEISRYDLNEIFLMTKTSFAGSGHVEPVLLKNCSCNSTFVKEYLGKTDSALTTYYRSLMFSGKASIPRSFESESKLAEYVARTKGAIGYVATGAAPRLSQDPKGEVRGTAHW